MPRFLSVFAAALLPFAAAAQTPAAPAIPTTPAAAPAIVAPAAAPAAAASPAAPVTQGELPALVRKILMDDPEMIRDAVQKLREKQEAEAKQKASAAMAKYKNDLFNDAAAPSAGAKDADVTIVEFFDYHCGYCKHMVPALTQLLKEDKKVRVVFREFPILSEDSVNAARAALAVNRLAPDKYFDYHTALMKHEGKFEEKDLAAMAKKIGISADALKAEMAKPEVSAMLDKDRTMAQELGISGTPGIIIGDTIVPGAVPYEELKKMVDNVRAGRKPDEAAPAAAAPAAPAAQ